MRLFLIALGLGLLLCVPFAIWGENFTGWFSGAAAVEWIRGWGAAGSLAVILLLMSDLFLPIPATGVMTAAGYVYGFAWGGTLSATGSTCAGLLGYALCRLLGRGVAVRLAGAEGLLREEARFRRHGPWLVAASRWLPLLPEVVTCLAGLARMPLRTFLPALLCGSIPLGFVYAAIGAYGQSRPGAALLLSILLPPLLWVAVRPWLRKESRPN